jgi:hypothetical protein
MYTISRNLRGNGTNHKGQMLPRHLFTLTRGIQIRWQPIKNYKKNFWKIFEIFEKKNFLLLFILLSNFLVRTLSYLKKK